MISGSIDVRTAQVRLVCGCMRPARVVAQLMGPHNLTRMPLHPLPQATVSSDKTYILGCIEQGIGVNAFNNAIRK